MTNQVNPDQQYMLAQKIADIITPVLLKYDISLPASQNPDYMRDDLAFTVASFMLREEGKWNR